VLLWSCAGQTVVIDTCGSDFDTTLSYSLDGSTHTADDDGPCGTRAVIAQTFASGSHTITIGMYSSGGSYKLRYWCGRSNSNCMHDARCDLARFRRLPGHRACKLLCGCTVNSTLHARLWLQTAIQSVPCRRCIATGLVCRPIPTAAMTYGSCVSIHDAVIVYVAHSRGDTLARIFKTRPSRAAMSWNDGPSASEYRSVTFDSKTRAPSQDTPQPMRV
jgi:hypothetical protein